jgi:hypothetical protein
MLKEHHWGKVRGFIVAEFSTHSIPLLSKLTSCTQRRKDGSREHDREQKEGHTDNKVSSYNDWPWKWSHQTPPKRRLPLTSRHEVTARKIWIPQTPV